jgi:hypothetical protein
MRMTADQVTIALLMRGNMEKLTRLQSIVINAREHALTKL